jgi:UrcA family protein
MGKFFFLSIAGCIFIPSVAFAGAVTETRVARVSYADLNILNAEGQKLLDHRLVRAARIVCAEDSSDPFAQLASYRCKRQALADARVQMNQAVAARQSSGAVLLAGR